MTTEIERRVDATLLALNCLRREGIIPLTAPLSPAAMAFVSDQIGEPVSKATFHRLQRRALIVARRHFQAHLTTLSSPLPSSLQAPSSHLQAL